MKIHTCKEGERLSDIAKQYGVTEENIIMANIPGCENPTAGEELLILTPTRTYRLRKGDSIERLCLRFGVRNCDIFSWNPWIAEEGLTPGRTANLRFDEKIYGMAPANGCLYPGFDRKRLARALPYLTYVTLGCAVSDNSGIKFIYDDTELVPYLIKENKVPLLRIYDKAKRDYKSKCPDFIEQIVTAATSKGYLGVVLPMSDTVDFTDYGEFLLGLRKAMIGCDLILISEVTADTPPDICELADGNILFYPKYALSPELSYRDGEREIYAKFAKDAESAKCFIDIPALAKWDKDYASLEESIIHARNRKVNVEKNANSLISCFEDKKQGRVYFNSLENTKNTLDIIEEFGFMGANFDINRTPLSHFLMYNMCFKTACHTYARAKEGCSKE